MAEAVAGLLTSAFVGIAKDKLASAIAQQSNLLWNFDGDLDDMKATLETISAALEDAERRSVKDSLVRLWLKRLKDAAMDISDVLEDYQDTTDQATTKKVPRVFSCLPITYKKIVMANRMKSMRDELRKINQGFETFKFMTSSTSTTIVHHYDDRETTSHLLLEELIKGRDVEKQHINNLLSTRNNNGETLIIAIYGLGGMGKSTLAQLVFKDTELKYDHRIWVYVSRDFNLVKIGNSIISQLPIDGGQHNRDSLQGINQCLHNQLSGKKVLIVLDDLWEEKNTELHKLRNMLCVEGTMIDVIVTTRKEDIAFNVATNEPYKLQPLSDGICWEIIKGLSKYEQKSNSTNLEHIGQDIARKCGGVALAAQALGSILRSIDDLEGWTKIKNSDVWYESSECDVLPSLKLSYERMPPQLRACFSYCAIFSKGHNIVEDDLIHQWIALDFIEPSKGKECIKQLLAMSFLQVSKLPMTSRENVVHYTMHDLVHDLARLTMADELMVSDAAPDRDTHGHKNCRYSLLNKYDQTKSLADILPLKIRALHLSDNRELDIPNGAFSFAKYLRTLDFSGCSGILLPSYIGHLKQLRFLTAPRMQNKSLPKFITEASKLQFLNINGSSQISELPESIGNLGCLKYLSLSDCVGLLKLPESFGDLKCMVHLDMLGCSGIKELPNSLGCLMNLQHLELSFCSSIREIPESMCGLTQLQYLALHYCDSLDRLPESIGSLVNLKHLNMSYCLNIKELPESVMRLQNLLHLDFSCCYKMKEGLLGCLRGLTALQHLDVSSINSIGDEEAVVLEDVTNLKYLKLSGCCLSVLCKEGNDGRVVDFIGALTSLEHLDLSNNCNLACLPESVGNLKRLHTLKLKNCSKLKSLPESLGALELKSLVLEGCSDEVMDQASSLVHYSRTLPFFKVCATDNVKGCSNLPELGAAHHVDELIILSLENAMSLEEASKANLVDKHNLSRLKLAWNVDAVRHVEDKDLLAELEPPRGLKHLSIEGYSSTGFPGWVTGISRHLTNLVGIVLCDLHTCRNLPPLGQLRHLKHLKLRDLSSIKRIDEEFCGGKGAFCCLKDFSIEKMDALEEWNTTYPVDGVVMEFMFPVLDSLGIGNCPRLRLKPSPPTFRTCEIWNSNQVICSLDAVDKISHPSSLSRGMHLALGTDGDCCPSMMLLHHFPALQSLYINCPKLTSLPESIRCLTSLESLQLYRCEGISALPEWLADLSALKILYISSCTGIKSLPSCIQNLTNLQELGISWNQELKKWCEAEENKMKLAHINDVDIW